MNYQKHPEDIDFKKYWLIFKRHRKPSIFIFILIVAASLVAALTQKEIYQASGKLKFKKQNASSSLITEAGEKIGQLDTLKFINTPLDTEAEVLRSYEVVNQTIKDINLTNDNGELVTYQDFIKALELKNIPGTDILSVSYKNPDPEQARQVVDRLMESYLESNVTFNRVEAAAARKFINEQLPKSEEYLSQTEIALRDFKEQHNTVNLQTESQLKVEEINELNIAIQRKQALVDRLTNRIANLEAKLGFSAEKVIALNDINDSEAIQLTITQLQGVRNRLAKEQSRFSSQNPAVIDLQEEKASLEALLKKQIGSDLSQQSRLVERFFQTGDVQKNLAGQLVSAEVERREVIEEIATLERTLSQHQARAREIPELEQTQRGLERKLDAAQSAYQTLLNNFQQVQIAENQNVGNAQVIDSAIVSEYPVSTSKKLILAMGIAVGGMFSVVTAFVLEIRDPSIKTSKELAELFDYKLLGSIPNYEKKALLPEAEAENKLSGLPSPDPTKTMMAETYKMLNANLKFLCPDRDTKVVVVTSSLPKEGKSTVSANLAAVSAQQGKRVLLIDADLHRPQQHHIWKLSNETGLSDAILNQELKSAISAIAPNLSVLTSGVVPPNSISLLESHKMDTLIQSLKADYDEIIIDTPPLLLFADALVLSKIADGILLVGRPGTINKENVKTAKDRLQIYNANVLGITANGVILENEPDSYFHYAESYYLDSETVRTLPKAG